MRNTILVFNLICCIVFSGIIGCVATEKQLLDQYYINYEDPEAIGNLADYYYRKKEYSKAIEYYKEIEELDSLSKLQQYHKNICSTLTLSNNKSYWQNINPIRNSNDVEYEKFSFKPGIFFIYPSHWILFCKKQMPPQSTVDVLEFPTEYSAKQVYVILKNNLYDLDENRALFYCGWEFITIIKIDYPESKASTKLPRGGKKKYKKAKIAASITRKFPSKLFKENLEKNFLKSYNDVEMYYYKTKKQRHETGNKISFEKIRIQDQATDNKANLYQEYINILRNKVRNNACLSGHISWLVSNKKNTRISYNLFFRTNTDIDVIIVVKTRFQEKFKDIYIKEVETFMQQIKLSEDII